MASPPIAAHDLKVRSVAFLIVLWIGLFCIAEINAGGVGGEVLGKGGHTQREFDYFKLALQWPGTFCRRTRHCCSTNGCCRGSNAPQGFTIHGLWPDYNDGTWPSCCSGKKFDVKEVSTLLGDMNKYWPTLSCGSTSNCHGGKGLFWEHEWEKHGTCSSSVTGAEYNYFVTGLNLYFKYNVTKDIIWSEDEERLLIEASLETNGLRELNVFQEDLRILSKLIEMQQKESKLLKEKSKDRIGKNSYQEVLREAGYVASNSEKYPLGGIISAIQNAFHLTPELECSGGAVQELRLCFYKDFKPRDCAADAKAMVNSKKSCPKYVSLPEYASLKLGNGETEASEPTLQSAI